KNFVIFFLAASPLSDLDVFHRHHHQGGLLPPTTTTSPSHYPSANSLHPHHHSLPFVTCRHHPSSTPSSLLTTTTTTATKMSRPLSRAQLENWRREVAAKRKSINDLDHKILQQEMSLQQMRRTVAALRQKATVEEARFAEAEAQVLAAEARANQNQTGRLLFSSGAFLCKFSRADIKRRFCRIEDAKTDACPLSLATDRQSLVLANGYWQFQHINRSPFISEGTIGLLTESRTLMRLVNSDADEASFINEEDDDAPAFSWDSLFRCCLPRLTGLTSLTLVIKHELVENMIKLSRALAESVAAVTTTSSTSTSTSSSPPLSQLTTLRMICLLEVKEKEEEEKNLLAIKPLNLPALTHLTLSLHCAYQDFFDLKKLQTGSYTVNAFYVFFRSSLLSAVLPQLSSLQLHSDLFAGEAIRSVRDHLSRLYQLLPTLAMDANPPALQLSLALRRGEDKANLVELVEQLLPNKEEEKERRVVAIRTRQALASITHLKICAIPDWPLPRFLSALIHLKRLNFTIIFTDFHSSLCTADYLATLTTLCSLPYLEEMVLVSKFDSIRPPLLPSHPSLPHLPPGLPVLAPLRRLTIDFYASSCAEDPAEFFHLAHCFPRVEELKMKRFRGLSDWTGSSAEEEENVEVVVEDCFNWMFHLLTCQNPDHRPTDIRRWAKALKDCSLSLHSPEGNFDWHN
ncbi:hypothetical protein TYRP_001658, partial [Tyrophagus putrescentiae]